jgi:ABC-type branched-subunit amino acid transport system substrate-binding protein
MRAVRRLVACAAVLAGAIGSSGVSGCAGQGATSPKASGNELAVYVSAPPGTQPDVLAAERLAFTKGSRQVGRFGVKFVVLHGHASSNARTAIEDSSAIAYIGEAQPGLSGGTIGITNAQDLLQVSPTDTATELTRSTPAVKGAPGIYYESRGTYGRTFARVVPTSVAEARAQVAEMRSLGVKKVYVTDDSSSYGKAIAYAVVHAVGAPLTAAEGPPDASRVSSSGADAVFFGGTSAKLATSLFNGVGKLKLFAPSALYSNGFVGGLSGAARSALYVSSPGFLSRDLPAAARSQFVAPFLAVNHHQPLPGAIFGYEAVSAVLAVLKQAGPAANQRATVVRDFMRFRSGSSVLGSFSIDEFGNPTIAPFVFARVHGSTLMPVRSVQVPGGS